MLAAFVIRGTRKEVKAKDYFMELFTAGSAIRKVNDIPIRKKTEVLQKSYIKNYWLDFLAEKYLSEFTTDDLKEFKLKLQIKMEGKSDNYKSGVLGTGLIAFRQAFYDGLIDCDITAGVKNFHSKSKPKGILTEQQAEMLFATEWKSKKVMLGNYLAYRTGFRVGEVCGLQKDDLMQINGKNFIYWRHSYNAYDGLHGTKTSAESKIPVTDDSLFAALLYLANSNPYNNGYVFWSDKAKNHHIAIHSMEEGLKEQLKICGFKDSAENITFHSWRHFHRTYMQVKGNATAATLSHVTAHSVPMIESLYGNHCTETDIQNYIEADKKAFPISFADFVKGNISGGQEQKAIGAPSTLIEP